MPLDKLLAESDWVVPQLPSGPATQGFIDRSQFAQMKPGAVLVNISRADIVDRAALIEALKSGRLGGFALDPLYEAPGRGDDELLEFDNVVLSPHIAAQPRFNALNDLAEMMERLSNESSKRMSKAFRFDRHGGPEVLRFEEVEVGAPGAGEVRMRNPRSRSTIATC